MADPDPRIPALELWLGVNQAEIDLVSQEILDQQTYLAELQTRLDGLNTAAPVVGDLLNSLREPAPVE